MRISIVIHEPLQGKERPRFSRKSRRPHMPQGYMDWKGRVRDHMVQAFTEQGVELPITRFEAFRIEAHGPARHDGDNLVGALFDAGLPDRKSGFAGVWKDDRVGVIPRFEFEHVKAPIQYWALDVSLDTESQV